MNIAKILIASCVVTLLGSSALGQEENALQERNVYLFMNGKMVRMTVNDPKMHSMMMKEFKPVPRGMMLYSSGGKLYYAMDRKMSGGKMLSTEIFGRDFGIGSQR